MFADRFDMAHHQRRLAASFFRFTFSDKMSFRKEEHRVEAVVDSLIDVIPPVGHKRVKWDKVSASDRIRVVSTLGQFVIYDIFRDKNTCFLGWWRISCSVDKTAA